MKKGDRVKLIATRHGYCKINNPIWGYEDKYIFGTIIDDNYYSNLNIRVKWDNDGTNEYSDYDLILAEDLWVTELKEFINENLVI